MSDIVTDIMLWFLVGSSIFFGFAVVYNTIMELRRDTTSKLPIKSKHPMLESEK